MFQSVALASCLLLAACSGGSASGDESSSQSSSAQSVMSEDMGTRNVSYEGILQKPGSTIFQEGTHSLTLADGRMIMLEVNDPALDLNQYINKQVEVRGTARPTVEAGGTIMSVELVTVIGEASSSATSSVSSYAFCGGIAGFPCPEGFSCADDPRDTCDPTKGGADCSGVCVPSSSVSSVPAVSSVAVSSVQVSSIVAPPQSSSVASQASSAATSVSGDPLSPTPVASEEDIVLMAKQKYDDAAQWTQKYCTTHIGFCVPAHRNWYYKSFGTTTSFLWHVEFGIKDFEGMGGGQIVMNLAPGSSAQAGGLSGNVQTKGTTAVGYLDWQENRHFEIIGDVRLQSAIQYMTTHISSYDAAQ